MLLDLSLHYADYSDSKHDYELFIDKWNNKFFIFKKIKNSIYLKDSKYYINKKKFIQSKWNNRYNLKYKRAI